MTDLNKVSGQQNPSKFSKILNTLKKNRVNLAIVLSTLLPLAASGQEQHPELNQKASSGEQLRTSDEKVDIMQDPMAYALANFKTYFPDDKAYTDFRYMIGIVQKDIVMYNELSALFREHLLKDVQDPHDQILGIRWIISELFWNAKEIDTGKVNDYEAKDEDNFIDALIKMDFIVSERSEDYLKRKEKEIAERKKGIEEGKKEIEEGKKEIEEGKKEIEEGKKRIKKDLLSWSPQEVKENPYLLKAVKNAKELEIYGDTEVERAHIKVLYDLIK